MNKKINKIVNWIEMGYTRLNYKEELSLVDYIKQLQQENKQLKDKIDKAIEYIENNSLYEEEYDYDYEENSYLSGIDDETAKKDLLKILRGGINCENDFYNDVEELMKENKKYQEVIEKAIEYMKNNATSNYFDKEKNMFRREEDLLEILNEMKRGK